MNAGSFRMLAPLSRMSRGKKRVVMVVADLLLLPLALYLAFALRLSSFSPSDLRQFWWLAMIIPVASIPIFTKLGLYRAVVRYMGPEAAYAVIKGVTLSTLLMGVLTLVIDRHGFPRSVLVIYWLLALVLVGGSRFTVRSLFHVLFQRRLAKEPVIIYGAGSSGVGLASALWAGREYDAVAFVDDDAGLHGSVINGVRVYPPENLPELVSGWGVNQVLLAIPGATKAERRQVLARLEGLPVRLKTIPQLSDLAAGAARVDQIRDVDIDDLLGRDPVAPNDRLLLQCIQGKVVLVTGAGGSIGSELCRQILRLGPSRLVLFEVSEYALYAIERELQALKTHDGLVTEIVPLLGSVADRARLEQVMKTCRINTVYHAAAYKHVPMVEFNLIEGIRNNVFGTHNAALAARAAGVEVFVLVSTDKAVRPTNVMGASKRLAELVLQGLAQEGCKTLYCMVRFGNVLGSSGSVVPLFREQISRGGPVTVTHQDITRYFMTIPEAAALVIQAGALAKGGDVLVLDMGEPVRIVDLARKMIRLMGLEVRDEANPRGDIEIQYTGLRPGEKLFEELLIGENVAGTQHPMIMRAEEAALSPDELTAVIARLQDACDRYDCPAASAILRETVQGYAAPEGLQDLLWQHKHGPTTDGAPDNVRFLTR